MISIITPLCGEHIKYLPQTWESVKQQFSFREWLIMPNHGATKEDVEKVIGLPHDAEYADRVRIVDPPTENTDNIGALKRRLCELARGEIIVELDDDDLLAPDACDRIAEEIGYSEDGLVQFAYSNSARFEDKTWKSPFYNEYWGWEKREHWYNGHQLWEMKAFNPSPHMMRLVFWAPNHVRAWDKKAYFEVGGHDVTMKMGDDHDLCCRFYLKYGAKGLKHIDECLYYYREHDSNHCKTKNPVVIKQTWKNYHKYIIPMAVKWAQDNNLRCVELGSREERPGFESWDLHYPSMEYSKDLNKDWAWVGNGSVGVVIAYHILEHLRDPVHSMNELHRMLAPGGFAFIVVPSSDSRAAFQDPTHRSFWNANSFWYYTNQQYAKYIQPWSKARFQQSFLGEGYIDKENDVKVVEAHLINLKDGYKPIGEVKI